LKIGRIIMIRDKKYNIATHILTTGRTLISRHLEYIFNMICHEHAPDLINSINFCADKPKYFGSSMGSSKAISINLIMHFTHAVKESKISPQYSVKSLLIAELVSTCVHEIKHIMLKAEPGIDDDDDSDTDYQENEAQRYEDLHRYDVAKYVNVEITEFGPFIDEMMANFYKELTDARNNNTMDSWQEQQLYMIDNGIVYHDTRNSLLLKSMFDFFNYFSTNKTGWDRSLIPVFEPIEEFEETTDSTIDTPPSTEVNTEENFYENDENIFNEEIISKQETPYTVTHTTEIGPIVVPDNCDPLMNMETCENTYKSDDSFYSDEYEQHDMSSINSNIEETIPTQNIETTPLQAAPEGAVDSQMNSLSKITQIVMHRLFNHIFSKCDWNGAGKFDNPNAILDPVSINDIEGAAELFTRIDTYDANGKYKTGLPTNGFLKGIPSQEGIPMYKLHLTVGNQTIKRTFIPQNPNKIKNGQPTPWAKKAISGHRLAMLLPENGSPKLYIETIPGQLLGQEKLTICNWDK
jgi:hypothetical protein